MIRRQTIRAFMPYSLRRNRSMKITIREGMVPGESLDDRLAWIERMGIDGIELHGDSLQMKRQGLMSAFHRSRVKVSAIEGIPRLLDIDPAVLRKRLKLQGPNSATIVISRRRRGSIVALVSRV